MSINRVKLLELLLQQINELPERFPGYTEALKETVAEIIELERNHRIKGTEIRIKVSDKCEALGRLLSEKRSASSGV